MIRLDELEAQAQRHAASAQERKARAYVDVAHHVESHRFWDIAHLWAQETQRHHSLIARVLAKAVVRDGLRLQSHIPAHIAEDANFCWGGDIVGYVSRTGEPPVLLRTSALLHLEAIVEKAIAPDPMRLHDEYVLKPDFQHWLLAHGLPLPAFWFSPAECEQAAGASRTSAD